MHFQNLVQQIMPVEGSIVECGVGPGRSLFDFTVISRAADRPRRIYGFDTFEGLPDPTSEDGRWNARIGGIWSYSREHVRQELMLAGLDEETVSNGITLVPGEFSQTLPSYDGGTIALLHIDVDIYESYKTALEHLYDHVARGGIIAFDEYRSEHWPGATKAVDEFFDGKSETIIKSPLTDLYYTIKE